MIRTSKRKILAVIASAIIAGLFQHPLLSDDEPEASWQAGIASVVITPDQPMWMTGYAHRNRPAEGKIHDLWAKALVLEDETGTRLAIITTDLLGIPRSLRQRVETAAAQHFQLKPEGLLLSASHTHCGPEINLLKGLTWEVGEERSKQMANYLDSLESKFIGILDKALNQMVPVKLSYTHARAGFAMNRRLKTDGGYVIAPNPDGPVDQTVPVLQVRGLENELHALLLGYACHNTTLSFYQLCGDYSGFAQAYLEESHPETTALFIAGCAGDQNPYPRRSLDLAKQHGKTLANAVEAALETQPRTVRGPLKSALEDVVLEFAEPPSRAELEARLGSEDQYERLHARMMLEELENNGRLRRTYPYPIQVIQFGEDLTFVALAGEAVVDYSLRLKSELGDSLVWVAAYCNDVMGYVPTVRVLREGGYEPVGSTKFYGLPGPFAESVEERIVSKVHSMVKGLGAGD